MIFIKINRKELAELLNIKERTLKKYINTNTLEEKLKNIGYELKEVIKEGRNNYYILEKINDINLYNNLCKYAYNTNRKDDFSKYFSARTKENNILNKKELATISNVSHKTISKWDNTLLEKKIISKDGFFYFCIDKKNKTIYECSQEEYSNFWKNINISNSINELQEKLLKEEITLNEFSLAVAGLGAITALTEDKYYYRTKKYKTNTKNQLYKDTKKLIESIYGDSINDIEIKLIENK